jgi:hypothetical protein
MNGTICANPVNTSGRPIGRRWKEDPNGNRTQAALTQRRKGLKRGTDSAGGIFSNICPRGGDAAGWVDIRLEGTVAAWGMRKVRSWGLGQPAGWETRLPLGDTRVLRRRSFLLATEGASMTVKGIAEGLSYTPRAIRRAADALVAARFIQAATRTPAAYRIDAKAWAALLEPSGKRLAWRYWSPVFAFMADLAGWTEGDGALSKTSAYVLSTRARDLVDRHRIAFARNQIKISHPEDYPDEKYLQAFEETLRRLAQWLEECA